MLVDARRWLRVLVAGLLFVGANAHVTFAQLSSQAASGTPQASGTDVLEALAFIDQFSRDNVFICYRDRQPGAIDSGSFRITGRGLKFRCTMNTYEGPVDFEIRFADEPATTFLRGARARIVRNDPHAVEQFLSAWTLLASARATDGADDAFRSAAESTDQALASETLRRVQVQVEAALRDNHNIDAARLYRDALRNSPSWAEGHFNLGLLYGDLELYPEAITEMRRYLYLTPSAQDARAVQDKIYEWEAALAGSAQ